MLETHSTYVMCCRVFLIEYKIICGMAILYIRPRGVWHQIIQFTLPSPSVWFQSCQFVVAQIWITCPELLRWVLTRFVSTIFLLSAVARLLSALTFVELPRCLVHMFALACPSYCSTLLFNHLYRLWQPVTGQSVQMGLTADNGLEYFTVHFCLFWWKNVGFGLRTLVKSPGRGCSAHWPGGWCLDRIS